MQASCLERKKHFLSFTKGKKNNKTNCIGRATWIYTHVWCTCMKLNCLERYIKRLHFFFRTHTHTGLKSIQISNFCFILIFVDFRMKIKKNMRVALALVCVCVGTWSEYAILNWYEIETDKTLQITSIHPQRPNFKCACAVRCDFIHTHNNNNKKTHAYYLNQWIFQTRFAHAFLLNFWFICATLLFSLGRCVFFSLFFLTFMAFVIQITEWFQSIL